MSKTLKARCISAIPQILILWIGFLTLVQVDTSFVILAFFASIFYTIYSYQVFSAKKFVKACLLHYIIALLAILTSLNLPLLIIGNLLITFAICYYFCTDLSPTGYTIYLLEFIFLQMRPISISKIPLLLLLLTIVFAIMFVVLGLRSYFLKNKKQSPNLYQNIFKDASDYIKNLSLNSENIMETSKKLDDGTDIFYHSFYASNTYPSTITLKSILDYYIIVLVKRIKSLPKLLPEQLSEKDKKDLLKLSDLFENCHQNVNQLDNTKLIKEINALKTYYSNESSNANKHIVSILALLERIISKVSSDKKVLNKSLASGVTLAKAYINMHGFKNYIKMNKFRLAFALRITIVAVCLWPLSRLIDNPFAYWLPLNTLLMLNPSYEASKTTSNDRIIGNFVGCALVFIVLHLFPYPWMPIALFLSCSAIFYCWVQRQWSSNIWSGIYGTALVTFSLGVNEAIFVKLAFLLAGFLIALFANRFIFTKPRKTVFIDNFRNIGVLLKDELNLMLDPTHDKKSLASSIYWMMQLHFTEKQMIKHVQEEKISGTDELLLISCKLLDELSSTIENIFFLFINIDDENQYVSDINLLKELLDKFISQNNNDILENIELINKLQENADNILSNLRQDQFLKDDLALTE